MGRSWLGVAAAFCGLRPRRAAVSAAGLRERPSTSDHHFAAGARPGTPVSGRGGARGVAGLGDLAGLQAALAQGAGGAFRLLPGLFRLLAQGLRLRDRLAAKRLTGALRPQLRGADGCGCLLCLAAGRLRSLPGGLSARASARTARCRTWCCSSRSKCRPGWNRR